MVSCTESSPHVAIRLKRPLLALGVARLCRFEADDEIYCAVPRCRFWLYFLSFHGWCFVSSIFLVSFGPKASKLGAIANAEVRQS
mmetsp:Transcript_12794/g.47269  ORF Transcript_12794/g.47269 Transcript_12794/m.47269 type:complete len:85 (+) Transcript_12794:583-837(+)